jgi:hypothetical protein
MLMLVTFEAVETPIIEYQYRIWTNRLSVPHILQGGLHILVGNSVGHRTTLEYDTHSETTHLKYGPHYLVKKVTF